MVTNLNELIALAEKRLYTPEDIKLIESGYILALEYSKNRFRYRLPKRPFIEHLIGTCSVLMYNNLNIETVVAGLLHSVKPVSEIYSFNSIVGEIVNNYFDTSIKPVKSINYTDVNSVQWSVMCIQLANQTDMLCAGELKL